MPYESKAQAKKFRVLEQEGKLKPGTASRWAHETRNLKRLPEHKRRQKKRGKTRSRGRG